MRKKIDPKSKNHAVGMIIQPFKIGLIFTHRYDEDKGQKKEMGR